MTFRGLLMWVHLVLGLTGAVLIAMLGVTGAYITLQPPLRRAFMPVPGVEASNGALDVPAIVAAVEGQFAPRRVANIQAGAPGEAVSVRLRDRSMVFVDPVTSAVIGSRQARVVSFENFDVVMRRLHINLLMGRNGRMVLVAASVETVFLVLTGAWLWWRRKHWRFTPWRGSVFRVSWDLHNATGVWFLLPVLIMAVTAVLFAMPGPVFRLAGEAEAPWPAPATSTATDGTPVNIARVVIAADSAVPGAPITSVIVPGSRNGAFAVAKPGVTVFVDQYSGGVLDVVPARVPTAGDHALETVRYLHTGEQFGLPGQVIWSLGSLMLAVMTVTGVVLGWKRLLILAGRQASDEKAR